jgi:thiosulfate oxidation carrier complex protein SoxZ
VRIIVRHPMETGYRTDESGKSIPRNVIRSLSCRYNGEVVFSAKLSSGIAANPYLKFFVTAKESGPLAFEWGRRQRRARQRHGERHGRLSGRQRLVRWCALRSAPS